MATDAKTDNVYLTVKIIVDTVENVKKILESTKTVMVAPIAAPPISESQTNHNSDSDGGPDSDDEFDVVGSRALLQDRTQSRATPYQKGGPRKFSEV